MCPNCWEHAGEQDIMAPAIVKLLVKLGKQANR